MHRIDSHLSFAWSVARRWPGQYAHLHSSHAYLLGALAPADRERLVSSALRVGSMIYMLSRVLGVRFRERPALLTGMSAALFDDLLDEGLESPESLRRILEEGGARTCSCSKSAYLDAIHHDLCAELGARERAELGRHLAALLDAEAISLTGGDPQWAARGYRALRVFLAVLGLGDDDVDQDACLIYGEYLQILDDYEDVSRDQPELNYFATNPAFDVNAHYLRRVRPALPHLFRRPFSIRELIGFSDTYHSYYLALYGDRHRAGPEAISAKLRAVRLVIRTCGSLVPF